MTSQIDRRAPSGARIRSSGTWLLVTGLAFATGAFPSVSRLEQDVRACVAVIDTAERLACFDAAADRLMNQSNAEPDARSASDAGLPSASRSESPPIPEAVPPPVPVQARIEHLAQQPRGERIFQLSNGEIWVELEPGRAGYESGMTVVIERTALGGYMLSTDGGRATRVRRVR
ncbi:MAG: hypothetical protein AB7I04_11835 [Pseudomonadales bacterium]